jgi:hypothetical protein
MWESREQKSPGTCRQSSSISGHATLDTNFSEQSYERVFDGRSRPSGRAGESYIPSQSRAKDKTLSVPNFILKLDIAAKSMFFLKQKGHVHQQRKFLEQENMLLADANFLPKLARKHVV